MSVFFSTTPAGTEAVASARRAARFYIGNFNLKPIDILTEGPGGPTVGSFLRLDRGKERVDHRECLDMFSRSCPLTQHPVPWSRIADNLFLQTSYPASDTPTIHHSAYELFDVDHEVRRLSGNTLMTNAWC